MKKLLILLILLFSINISQAKTYYYTSLKGLVNSTDGGTFCDVEAGTCKYDESVDVRIEFDKHYIYADLGAETVLSYALIGDDRDSSTLSISTNDTLFLDADDLTLDTTAKTITIPGELLDTAGEVRITLTAQNAKGDIQAQDYVYVNVATINSKNMLTRWTVSAGETISFPFNYTYFTNTYNGHVDWGDNSGIETFENVTIQSLTHTYAEAGTYEIRIDGGFANEKNFTQMFLQQIIPEGMDINQWDVSNVKIMLAMFNSCTLPTGFDISSWDVSNVYNIQTMFANDTLPSNFNISSWDVSNVTNIAALFANSIFSEDLNLSSWNLKNVSDTVYTFNNITVNNIIYDAKMNEEIYSNFLKLITTSYEFSESTTGQKIVAGENACSEDNEECLIAREWIKTRGWTIEDATVDTDLVIDKETALESIWTVSAGETVQFPFNNTYSIVSGIIDWGDGIVEEFDDWSTLSHTYTESGTYTTFINGSWGSSLYQTFKDKTIPSNLNIISWNFSKANITSLMGTFSNTTLPTGFDISSWDVSNVKSLWSTFVGITISSNLGINNWDVSNVTKVYGLFTNSTLSPGVDISSWDVSNVRDAQRMFYGTTIPNNFSLAGWNLSNVDTYTNMFSGATISGDLIYDESVGRTVYAKFIEILADDDTALPDSTTSQKIYVGDNRCSLGDTDCETAETKLTNKGWVITRTKAD